MTVFVHIGAHKTGSTLLQNMLQANSDALLEQGTFYQRGPGRHPFWHFYRNNDPDKFRRNCAVFRDRFRANAETYTHVVFSSETMFGTSDLGGNDRLYPRAPMALDALAGILDGLDAQIVLYVRRQDRFIESTFINRIQTLATSLHLDHQTLIRDQSWADFPSYLASFDPHRLSWLDLARDVADRFGAANLTLRPFESITQGRQQFCETFFGDFSDTAALDFTQEVFENRSFSDKALKEFLRRARDADYQKLKNIRLELQATYPTPDYPKPAMLTDAQRAEILSALAADNQQLFDEFVAPGMQEFRYEPTP